MGSPHVAPDTRARIEAVMRRRGYQPNPLARGLAGGPTGLVAVIAPEINSGFYAEVLRGVSAAAQKYRAHLLSCIAHDPEDYVQLAEAFARGRRVDGVILLAPPDAIFERPAHGILVPMVLCACSGERRGRGWDRVDTVTVRNEEGMTALLRHLWDGGRRRFLHVAGPADVYDAQVRRRAFKKFLKSQTGAEYEVIAAGQNREDGYEAFRRYWLRRRSAPDAVVCFNDSTAFGVWQALRELGIEVPRTTAVTGCDDEPASASLGLTSLRMPMREMGEAACHLLFARRESPRRRGPPEHRTFDLVPVLRGSTGVSASGA